MDRITIAQSLLLRFCDKHGYTDIRFIGSDRLSSIDLNGYRRHFGINLYGDILDLDAREVIAAVDTSHDIANTYDLPSKWTLRSYREER